MTTTWHKALQGKLAFVFSPVTEMNKLEQIKCYAFRSLVFLKQFLDH